MAASAQRAVSAAGKAAQLAVSPRYIRSPALGSSLGSDRSPKPRALCGICLTWKQPPALALLARQWT